ncbi:MAG: chemotaxis response regulator protein-glutamate methylesterase [Spirochaetaceae bacterium]|nr:chemotaxis response regulator protein-glutamate methylesterase [Spirochaetaceae bacterium]
MDDIKVLVVDDSAFMRNIISKIIEATPGLFAVGKAMNGKYALEKIPLVNPDIIILDIEMPEMNGIEFLKERKRLNIDIPVIVLSSIAQEGASVTMQCLALGASDFLTKPSVGASDLGELAKNLSELLLSYGGQYKRTKSFQQKRTLLQNKNDSTSVVDKNREISSSFAEKRPTSISVSGEKLHSNIDSSNRPFSFSNNQEKKEIEEIRPYREPGKIEVIAIGISTGGPNALREVFAKIDPNLSQPILVVQHMPAGFTAEFANSLNQICPLEVKEAKDGDLLKPGRILIAPGNMHMYVEKRSLATIVRLSDAPLCNGHRPSVDVLFESVAKCFQNRALGVIMTGMGKDGAAQLAEMRREGAWTLGQDEESSIVYGMPKVAFEYGGVQRQVSLSDMADAISKLARDNR